MTERKTTKTKYNKVAIRTETGVSEFQLRDGLGFQAIKPAKSNPIEFDCTKADCGICIIKVISGADNLSSPTTPEADFLNAMHADKNERLACQCRVFGDVEILIEEF